MIHHMIWYVMYHVRNLNNPNDQFPLGLVMGSKEWLKDGVWKVDRHLMAQLSGIGELGTLEGVEWVDLLTNLYGNTCTYHLKSRNTYNVYCVLQNTAKVWKGKKMPGHMGMSWRTLKGLKVNCCPFSSGNFITVSSVHMQYAKYVMLFTVIIVCGVTLYQYTYMYIKCSLNVNFILNFLLYTICYLRVNCFIFRFGE